MSYLYYFSIDLTVIKPPAKIISRSSESTDDKNLKRGKLAKDRSLQTVKYRSCCHRSCIFPLVV